MYATYLRSFVDGTDRAVKRLRSGSASRPREFLRGVYDGCVASQIVVGGAKGSRASGEFVMATHSSLTGPVELSLLVKQQFSQERGCEKLMAVVDSDITVMQDAVTREMLALIDDAKAGVGQPLVMYPAEVLAACAREAQAAHTSPEERDEGSDPEVETGHPRDEYPGEEYAGEEYAGEGRRELRNPDPEAPSEEAPSEEGGGEPSLGARSHKNGRSKTSAASEGEGGSPASSDEDEETEDESDDDGGPWGDAFDSTDDEEEQHLQQVLKGMTGADISSDQSE